MFVHFPFLLKYAFASCCFSRLDPSSLASWLGGPVGIHASIPMHVGSLASGTNPFSCCTWEKKIQLHQKQGYRTI